MEFTAITKFKERVDLNKLKVVSASNIVWVFGGPYDIRKPSDNLSNRHVFLNEIYSKHHQLSTRVKIPESYQDWNSFEGYADLLQFERDAAYLSNFVILFCESPGALAELGTFAADDELCKKTLVIISNQHLAADSYISLGPIKKIGMHDEHAICVVDANNPNEFIEDLPAVFAAVEQMAEGKPKEVAFKPQHTKDVFLLIADLVDLFHALTRQEILGLLLFFKVCIDDNKLRQYIKQLLLFKLIEERHWGVFHYLTPGKGSKPYVKYQAALKQSAFDRQRFKTKSHEDMMLDDKRKIKAKTTSNGFGS